MLVPLDIAATLCFVFSPLNNSISNPEDSILFEVRFILDTADMLGRASPLKPNVVNWNKSFKYQSKRQFLY